MIKLFYLFLFIFILNELFYFSNRRRLDLFFKKKDPTQIKKIDILYYLIKILSVLWPIVGLFSGFRNLFIIILLLGLFKFILYHFFKKIYSVYVDVYPILLIIIYIIILFYKFTQTLNFFRCSSVIIIKSYPFLLHQFIIVSHFCLFL